MITLITLIAGLVFGLLLYKEHKYKKIYKRMCRISLIRQERMLELFKVAHEFNVTNEEREFLFNQFNSLSFDDMVSMTDKNTYQDFYDHHIRIGETLH